MLLYILIHIYSGRLKLLDVLVPCGCISGVGGDGRKLSRLLRISFGGSKVNGARKNIWRGSVSGIISGRRDC